MEESAQRVSQLNRREVQTNLVSNGGSGALTQ